MTLNAIVVHTGSCSLTLATAEGVLVGTCDCKYGWGGEACADRVVSTQVIALQTSILVLSNLAIFPSVLLAHHLRCECVGLHRALSACCARASAF
jgi:hypothetical protein